MSTGLRGHYPERCFAEEQSGPTLIVIVGFRIATKDFAPSCFHSASMGIGNANAAPEGGL